MVNGAIFFLPATRDLCFQQRDPLIQLLDRKGVEILLAELHRGIVFPAWKIVHVHQDGTLTLGHAMSITPAW